MRLSGFFAIAIVVSAPSALGCGGEYPVGAPPTPGAQPAATFAAPPPPGTAAPTTESAASGSVPAIPPSVLGSLFIDELAAATEGTAGSADGHPGDSLAVLSKPTPATGVPAGHFIAVCSVPFTITAATPGWSNAPYDFVASLVFDGVVVGSQRFAAGPGAHDTSLTASVTCDGLEHPFDHSGQTVLAFRVDGNWTARPASVSNNPPDRVKVHHVFAQIQYTR